MLHKHIPRYCFIRVVFLEVLQQHFQLPNFRNYPPVLVYLATSSTLQTGVDSSSVLVWLWYTCIVLTIRAINFVYALYYLEFTIVCESSKVCHLNMICIFVSMNLFSSVYFHSYLSWNPRISIDVSMLTV